MKPYNEFALCPKCGNQQIGTRYHKWASRYGGDSCADAQEQEHLDRWCQRCQFKWPEGVAMGVSV